MRRLAYITAFALSLALPLWAQHGGGGHGGGAHASGSVGHGGFSGHAGGGRISGGMGSGGVHAGGMRSGGIRSGGIRSNPGVSRGFTRPQFAQRGFSRGPFLHDGFRRNRVRVFGFRNNCFTYGCRGFYPYGGFYDPYWWSDSGSSYDEDGARDRDEANAMNQQSLEEQEMRRQNDDYVRDPYARQAPTPQPSEPATVQPDTVLVYRDQHKREVKNYAIVGPTLWNFAPQRTEKISLSDLDLDATIKANDERGLTFRVPAAGEGQ
jgi:hypothetical protein